jgi:hypothetical protein
MEPSLKVLEHTYMTVSFGYQEPDEMYCSTDIYEFLVKQVGHSNTKGHYIKLNNAKATLRPSLEPGTWVYINTDHPKEPRYNGLFSLDNIEWHPAPAELLHKKVKTRFPEGAEL